MLRLWIGLLFLALARVAIAAPECGEAVASKTPYKYCIERGAAEGVVMYTMHVGGGNERFWFEGSWGTPIPDAWRAAGVKAPSVISVSFGPLWLLNEDAHGDEPGTQTLFVETIMPAMEAKLGIPVRKRLLQGASMGGFNAAMLLLKSPGLFSRVALMCPGLPLLGPYSTPAEIDAFIARTPGAERPHIEGLIEWTRRDFPTEASWARHDPFGLVSRLGAGSPPTYVSCGDRDQWGFFAGAHQFADRIRAQGGQSTWVPTSGGHCVYDAESVANFLAEDLR